MRTKAVILGAIITVAFVAGWKFRPRTGANPAFLVGPPVYAAWK